MIYDISLIIPAYNVEAYIEAALFSVSSQVTQAKVQCIVIDDASSDRTVEFTLRFNNLFRSNITLELLRHENNQGLASARNSGISHARARFLMFLDSDDILMPGAIDYLWRTALDYQADIVDSGFTRFSKEEDLNFSLNDKFNLLEITDPIHKMKVIRGFAWAKIYSRALFDGVNYPENLIFEDIITLPQLVARAQRVFKSDYITVAYRKRLGSLSGRQLASKRRFAMHALMGIEYLLSCESSRESDFSEAFNESLWNEMTIVFRSRSFYCSRSEMKEHLYKLSALLDRWISYSPRARDLLRVNLLNRCIEWSIRKHAVNFYRVSTRISKYVEHRKRRALLVCYGFDR